MSPALALSPGPRARHLHASAVLSIKSATLIMAATSTDSIKTIIETFSNLKIIKNIIRDRYWLFRLLHSRLRHLKAPIYTSDLLFFFLCRTYCDPDSFPRLYAC